MVIDPRASRISELRSGDRVTTSPTETRTRPEPFIYTITWAVRDVHGPDGERPDDGISVAVSFRRKHTASL